MLSDSQAAEQLGGQFTLPNVVRVWVVSARVSDSEWQPRESHSWATPPPQIDGVMGGGGGCT